MRSGAQTEKQYGGIAPANSDNAQTCKRTTSANGKRTFLMIQNTGPNDGLVRFGEPIQGDGSDLLFMSGSGLVFDIPATCPKSAINIGSLVGTTFAIIEGVTE